MNEYYNYTGMVKTPKPTKAYDDRPSVADDPWLTFYMIVHPIAWYRQPLKELEWIMCCYRC
jgi:hypothetical protein